MSELLVEFLGSLEALDGLFAQFRDGVTIADARKTGFPLLYVNPAFTKITGYSREESLERNCRFLQGDMTDQPEVQVIRQALGAFEPCNVVVKNITKDGELFWNELSISPIRDDTGEVRCFIGIQKDVTASVKLNRSLERANARLVDYNREVTNFTDMAAHDIKEPLRKISLLGDLLREDHADELSDQGKLYLDQIIRAARRQFTLISDLLAYTKIERKEQPLQVVDLGGVLKNVCDDLSEPIRETQASIEIGDLPRVLGNAMMLTHLFSNLIDNAIRYRKPEQNPRIRVFVEKYHEATELLGRICVEDNGIGFDQQHADLILEPFKRLHSQTEIEGTGLGLAICAKIAQQQKGHLVAEGTPGVGARFIVQLPLAG